MASNQEKHRVGRQAIQMNPQPKPVRIKLPRRKYKLLKLEVFERDGGICQFPKCGKYTKSPPHHVKLRSAGGNDSLDNLILLCNSCHNKVHNGPNKKFYVRKVKQRMREINGNDLYGHGHTG